MTAQGKKIFKRFAFEVEIQGVGQAGFKSVGPLEAKIGVNRYRQGGSPITIKTPGDIEYPDIVMKRGATQDQSLFDWFMDTALHYQKTGAVTPQYLRNVGIRQVDRDTSTAREWDVFGCFPVEFVAGDWDADAEENLIESVTLSVKYWDVLL